jgi:hypothetical protein
MHHIVPDVIGQVLEEPVSFPLVGDKGVALRHCLQPDFLSHLFHHGQVLHPEGVRDAQHNHPLQKAHTLGTDFFFPFLIQVFRQFRELLVNLFGLQGGKSTSIK